MRTLCKGLLQVKEYIIFLYFYNTFDIKFKPFKLVLKTRKKTLQTALKNFTT